MPKSVKSATANAKPDAQEAATDSSVALPLWLCLGENCFECHDGDIIGRKGTVATAALASVAVISRQHLQVHLDGDSGQWSINLSPKAHNVTHLDGKEMTAADAPRSLKPGEHTIAVGDFQFKLRVGDLPEEEEIPSGETVQTALVPGHGITSSPTVDFAHLLHQDFGGGEGLLRLIAGNVADLIAIVDSKGRRAWNNAAYFTCLGYPPDDPSRIDSISEVHPDDQPLVRSVFKESMRIGVGQNIEYRMRHREGHWVHLESRAQVVDGVVTGGRYLVLVARDITERREAETRSRQRNRLLAERTDTLARLSQSSFCQRGELERCYSLVIEAAVKHLGCQRAAVWRFSKDGQQLVCEDVFNEESAHHESRETLTAAACGHFFAAVRAERILVADQAFADLRLLELRTSYLTRHRLSSFLAVRLRLGEETLGLFTVERTGEARPWELEEQNFAASLADVLLLAIEARRRADAFQALQESQSQLAAELVEASKYVRALLPAPLNGRIETEWRFVPCEQLGGDAFGHHSLDDEHLALYLLDAVGHGVRAALLSISAINVLRSCSLPDTNFHDPAAVLRGLNSAFQMETQNNMFFTIWYGVFHLPTRRLTYAAAGHPPAILLDASQLKLGPPVPLSAPGLMIGVDEDARFENAVTVLPAPCRLYLFSDGVFELAKPDGEPWGFENFTALLGRPTEAGMGELDGLLLRAREVNGKPELPDDFSILKFNFS